MSELPAEAAGTHDAGQGKERRGIFARIALFIRQIVGELRKVVTPTRAELINYTIVVIVFVTVAMLFVTGLDLVVGQGAGWLFGN
ncbi:preprotein translocase subunit SecE [Isoptericola croceus]|uniref:preprotein translocase subunit SecE n=1 Tax=Isoptericola croceus TaxID=3031406 RepID=UPI0023F73BA2|nr:preprotein translocase subunit SecE [Isoptericola croceus]